MDNLKAVIKGIIAGYAGKAINGHTYMTTSPDETLFTVVGVGQINGQRFVTTSLIVRLVDDQIIIIERDQNDKLLVDALLQAGIPREKIVLAYAGEPVPEATV